MKLSRIWPCAGIIASWGVAFVISCQLADFPANSCPDDRQGSIAGAAVNETRSSISAILYEMADAYFHKGAPRVHAQAFLDDPLQKIAAVMSPGTPVHLAGQSVKETMPWLWLAIQADPHNVEACLVAAFLLAGELERPDLAHEVPLESSLEIKGTARFRRCQEKGGKAFRPPPRLRTEGRITF